MFPDARACLIDVEGTLLKYKGGEPVGGAVDWLSELHDEGFPLLLVTNTTTQTAGEMAAELRGKGFRIRNEEILSCVDAAAELLREHGIRSVQVIGNQRLHAFFAERGYRVDDAPQVDAVVVGLDTELTYDKLSAAAQALERSGTRLVALHENPLYRQPDRSAGIGVGAVVRALEYASGRRAVLVGKPSVYFYRQALNQVGFSPAETVMISDDPLTDLRGARAAGMRTIFVLSGKYPDESVLARLGPGERPEEVVDSVRGIRLGI